MAGVLGMTQPDTKRICLVTCGILRDELEAALQEQSWQVAVVYLPAAPCVDQAAFPRWLDRALARARQRGEQIVAVLGRCHPDVDAILARYGAHRLPMNNCVEALLGERMRGYLQEANTFFTTPAWLRHWRRALARGMRWDEVDARQNFGLYERILLLDAGVTAYTPEQVLAFFDHVQVPVEIVPVELVHLTELLAAALNGAREAREAEEGREAREGGEAREGRKAGDAQRAGRGARGRRRKR